MSNQKEKESKLITNYDSGSINYDTNLRLIYEESSNKFNSDDVNQETTLDNSNNSDDVKQENTYRKSNNSNDTKNGKNNSIECGADEKVRPLKILLCGSSSDGNSTFVNSLAGLFIESLNIEILESSPITLKLSLNGTVDNGIIVSKILDDLYSKTGRVDESNPDENRKMINIKKIHK
jgi:hypothetical protein